MQLTYTFLYLFFYLVALTSLLLFFCESINLRQISSFSVSSLLQYLFTYTTDMYLFQLNLVLFAGIPPAAIFFIKFQIIIAFVLSWDIFLLFFIFSLLLLNMIFYLQFFKFKIAWLYDVSLFQKINKKNTNKKNTKLNYSCRFLIHSLLFFSFTSLFFIQDILIIFSNFLY